jgi:hypothetical protein
MNPRVGMALIVLGVAVFFGGLVALDRLVLDPGGLGSAGDANTRCAHHAGVKEMDAHQGFVVCWDGTAR